MNVAVIMEVVNTVVSILWEAITVLVTQGIHLIAMNLTVLVRTHLSLLKIVYLQFYRMN